MLENSEISAVGSICLSFFVAGLAGIRVGYGAFPLGIIEFLWRAKQPYNVSVAAEVAACAALQNPEYLEVHALNSVLWLSLI